MRIEARSKRANFRFACFFVSPLPWYVAVPASPPRFVASHSKMGRWSTPAEVNEYETERPRPRSTHSLMIPTQLTVLTARLGVRMRVRADMAAETIGRGEEWESEGDGGQGEGEEEERRGEVGQDKGRRGERLASIARGKHREKRRKS